MQLDTPVIKAGYLKAGIAAAISVRISRERILNCMAPHELVAWTRGRSH